LLLLPVLLVGLLFRPLVPRVVPPALLHRAVLVGAPRQQALQVQILIQPVVLLVPRKLALLRQVLERALVKLQLVRLLLVRLLLVQEQSLVGQR